MDTVPASPSYTADEEISVWLPYLMASSRIAHYLKMIGRDAQGRFMEASDCQDWLDRWIAQWDDLVGFEIVPVISSAEAAARFGPA